MQNNKKRYYLNYIYKYRVTIANVFDHRVGQSTDPVTAPTRSPTRSAQNSPKIRKIIP